jgi:hypothetical protein
MAHCQQWSKAIATSRRGIDPTDTTASWAGGVNNWKKANEAMQAGNAIPDQIYRLFATNLSSWESFASTKSQPPSTSIDFMSLEAIHNAIHVSLPQLRMTDTVCRRDFPQGLADVNRGMLVVGTLAS